METHLSKSGAEKVLLVGPFVGANPVIIEEVVLLDGYLGNEKTPGDGAITIDDNYVEGGRIKLGITCIHAIKFENPMVKFVTYSFESF